MSTEQNKAIVQRFLDEVINTGNLAAIDELCAPDLAIHMGAQSVRGRDAFKQIAAAYFSAFPDLHETAEDVIAEGDRVVRRVTWRATHMGEFMGIPATGKQVTVSGMRIFRVAEGKLAEEWAEDDALGMLQQLGVIPAPGQAGA